MKEHRHLTSAQVEALLSGDLSAEAVRLATRILIAGCAICMEIVRLGVVGLEEAGIGSRPEDRPADS